MTCLSFSSISAETKGCMADSFKFLVFSKTTSLEFKLQFVFFPKGELKNLPRLERG